MFVFDFAVQESVPYLDICTRSLECYCRGCMAIGRLVQNAASVLRMQYKTLRQYWAFCTACGMLYAMSKVAHAWYHCTGHSVLQV